ncbi:hypothetical protein DZD52_18755 [Xanthomonas nasturtii]|uniref:Uncharacterized protein n=1 Tax=Xanthomonas nasturtii TaxID=1843581 RepID=A0A3E1KEP3_9XANT|nr:hypothetical protein DZD52_18755 [Xanthomonas nasturtii]
MWGTDRVRPPRWLPPRCRRWGRPLCASAAPRLATTARPVPAASRLRANRQRLNATRLAPCHPLL